MSDGGELKYRWTPESTSLLVSVWTDKQVQKQLEYAARPQVIWDSVARYMHKKGYNVSGKQCRSRMKQVLVCYREAKRAGTKAGVEQYYESIDRVLKLKRLDQICGNLNNNNNNNNHGIDTVDSVVNTKSPPKEAKTNKNLQMRYKYQQPAESIFRTEALSPAWSGGSENYPDSPESTETVLAQPFRVFSPVRDAATNTTQQQLANTNINKKMLQQNVVIEEAPIKETYRQSVYSNNNYFNDIPFQNTVQNVQNQIIQENMQQNQQALLQQQNLVQNQVLEQNRLQMNANVLRQNIQNANQALYTDQGVQYCQIPLGQQSVAENVLRMQQNNCQLNSVNNRAMPQEPRKSNFNFRQSLTGTYRHFQEPGLQNYNPNGNHVAFLSPSVSPDIPPNLNEAFCQQKMDKANGINEQYTRTTSNQLNSANPDVTAITNNATFNDDTISIEFLQDSPSPDEEPVKLKDFAVNTEEVPNAPLRKKKAEKLERLMINAINSQTEVVNKILAAQNDMVSRVLDLDRDRQNRLETRIDHLLDVVQSAVLNKSGSTDRNSEVPQPHQDPVITNLHPPPKPGVVPPKLDLVPPKPCRVPCTVSVSAGQPINVITTAATATTRPGCVSPVMSPSRRVGAIWQKLGPVSTSPFVRAQQQLGFKPVNAPNNDVRTQSSAERRITKEFQTGMDTKTLIFETANFIEAERQIQEVVENARIKESMSKDLQSRRRLFTQREPNAAMILTAAFLDAEIQSAEIYENARQNWLRHRKFEEQIENRAKLNEQRADYNSNHYAQRNNNNNEEVIIAGQGDSYERMKHLNGARERLLGDSRDSSTPAKQAPVQNRDFIETNEPRQTIQQLAQLVMNSARWRNATTEHHGIHRKDLNLRPTIVNTQKPMCPNDDPVILRNVPKAPDSEFTDKQPVDGKAKTIEWLQERFSYGGQPSASARNEVAQEIANRLSYNEPPKPPRVMGFTAEFLNNEKNNDAVQPRKQMPIDGERRVGFVFDSEVNKERFAHDEKDPFEELHQFYYQKQLKMQHAQNLPFIMQNGKLVVPSSDVIERYVQEAKAKQSKDTDSDNDEEFLDTTMSLHSSGKNSLTSSGGKTNCIIS